MLSQHPHVWILVRGCYSLYFFEHSLISCCLAWTISAQIKDKRLVSVLSFGASVTREQGSEFHVFFPHPSIRGAEVTVNSTVNGVASGNVNGLNHFPGEWPPRAIHYGAFGCGRATLHVRITKTINYRMILLYEELPSRLQISMAVCAPTELFIEATRFALVHSLRVEDKIGS
ncbi:hypothetical protein OIU84_002609 [Salix udensis]|uniref:Uncharacterized protein n=1 Tax=Salix udensis TaxID=889485 RepID=A0AAD6K6P9_9ROSI|nr:hypothetical protein OIU84_002609 [Salix udensis]